jgi:hypothetical protein
MTLRLLMTTAAAGFVVLAGIANASTDELGITVCSRMLEASLPNSRGVALKLRIELLNNGHVDTVEEYAAGEMTYGLSAVEAASGHPVATAACTINEYDEVVAMLLEPRAAVSPSLAVRFDRQGIDWRN